MSRETFSGVERGLFRCLIEVNPNGGLFRYPDCGLWTPIFSQDPKFSVDFWNLPVNAATKLVRLKNQNFIHLC